MSKQTLTQIYSKLSRADLVFLLGIRDLDTAGVPSELITRLAENDLATFPAAARLDVLKEQDASTLLPSTSNIRIRDTPPCHVQAAYTCRPKALKQLWLPPEIWTLVVRYTNDWELGAALFVSDIGIRRPAIWDHASAADLAVLHNDLARLKTLAAHTSNLKLPRHVVDVVLRFEYIGILEWIWQRTPDTFQGEQIPLLASRYNSPKVLQWWKDTMPVDKRFYTESCLDAASSSGHLDALNWWKDSGLPLKIGRVMDFASDEGDVAVLEWWKQSGLKFKYSKFAMRHASQNGHICVLEWWLNSGLQLFYDASCLDYATRFNRVAVLDWWSRCGLMIEYRIMDIEEALGEAVVGGHESRQWWRVQMGIDFGVNNSEWMRDRILNEAATYRHA